MFFQLSSVRTRRGLFYNLSVLRMEQTLDGRRCTDGSAHLRMKQSAWRTCALRYRWKSALESSAGGGGGGTASSMNLSRNAKLLSLRLAGSLEASFSTRSCSRLPCELRPASADQLLGRAGRLKYIGLCFRHRIAPRVTEPRLGLEHSVSGLGGEVRR